METVLSISLIEEFVVDHIPGMADEDTEAIAELISKIAKDESGAYAIVMLLKYALGSDDAYDLLIPAAKELLASMEHDE